MLSHRSVHDSLEAYADGSLPARMREQVDAHLRGCAECGKAMIKSQRLELALQDLPAAPAVPFPRFWSALREKLTVPKQRQMRVVVVRRLFAGLALAALASTVGIVALASDDVLPDNPLYRVKQVRQAVELAFAWDSETRLRLDVALASQRLYEAGLMSERRHDDLALATLEDFRSLLNDATPSFTYPPIDRQWAIGEIRSFATGLEQVRQVNAMHDRDRQVAAAIADDLAAIRALEADLQPAAGLSNGTPAASPTAQRSSQPTTRATATPAVRSTIKPAISPTPTPSPSPSPTESASASASPSPSGSATPAPSGSPSASASPSASESPSPSPSVSAPH